MLYDWSRKNAQKLNNVHSVANQKCLWVPQIFQVNLPNFWSLTNNQSCWLLLQ